MPLNLSDLLCGEDADGLLSSSSSSSSSSYAVPAEHHTAPPPPPPFPSDSDDSLAELIGGAADYSPGSGYSARFRSRSLDRYAREKSLSWILKVNEYYSFQPLTAYLAVNYFDRFLAAHSLPEENGWAMQLLSVACLSLAAKMEETLVPSLLDLQVEDARFVFEQRTVCKMELLVLTALKWRLKSVTPFTFIHFFAYTVDPSGNYSRYLISCATKIILATIYDIEFLDHCPSSVAAAAMICAIEDTPGLSLVDSGSAMGWCIGLTKEGIDDCYRLMQGIVIGNKKRKSTMILRQQRVTNTENINPEILPSPNKRRKLNMEAD